MNDEVVILRLNQLDKSLEDNRRDIKADLVLAMQKTEEYRKDTRETLSKVFAQVQTTNGRVSALEKWRSFIGGAVAVIVCVIGWWVALHSH